MREGTGVQIEIACSRVALVKGIRPYADQVHLEAETMALFDFGLTTARDGAQGGIDVHVGALADKLAQALVMAPTPTLDAFGLG
jgi:hypothetical protein